MWTAYAVAISADGLQFILGPLGWALADEVIDLAAMMILSLLVGFHPLFLPTFVVEFVPVVDMLPTWTGCLALTLSLRKKTPPPNTVPSPEPSKAPAGEVIDV